MAHVLVVDDDVTVREVVVSYMRASGHSVAEAADGVEAIAQMRATPADLILLDLMMPGMDGLEVCRRLRAMRDVPIIMLTALGSEADRVAGLESGADDYLSKPFSPRELTLRAQAILRRVGERPPVSAEVLTDHGLVVDFRRREVTLAGVPLALTVREFDLLAHFVRNPGVAFTREALLQDVWQWSFGDHSTVTVHVRRLREKIEAHPNQPTRLVTVWGVGYRWESES